MAAVVTFLVAAAAASAHMTVQPDEAVIGSFSRFVVRVPNERDDATTTAVQVELPPLAFVSFQDSPGWERTVEMTRRRAPRGTGGAGHRGHGDRDLDGRGDRAG
jgi:periplasmic copper chaperone A